RVVARQPWVPGEVDRAHAALADQPLDAVAGEDGARVQHDVIPPLPSAGDDPPRRGREGRIPAPVSRAATGEDLRRCQRRRRRRGRRDGGGSVKVTKQELVRLLRTEGDNDTADKAESQLPEEID